MTTAGGIDVGAGAVKAALVRRDAAGGETLLGCHWERIRRRDPHAVVDEVWQAALEKAGVKSAEVDYVASTGEGEIVEFRTGHFYSMTTHARGGRFLVPEANLVLDAGALHARAMLVDKVKKGSVGTWGQVPMPPNAGVKDEDIKTLVKWILGQK